MIVEVDGRGKTADEIVAEGVIELDRFLSRVLAQDEAQLVREGYPPHKIQYEHRQHCMAVRDRWLVKTRKEFEGWDP